MPVLDMSEKEMQKYFGSNIKPKDFEKFWCNKIKNIDEMELEYKIRKKDFNNNIADYFDLEFKSFDGTIIYAKYICPKRSGKFPIVLEFHDYGLSSRGWHHLTRYIGLGYSVIAMDCRGQGGKSIYNVGSFGPTVCGHLLLGIDDKIENMYYSKVYLDSYILSKIAMILEKTDNKNMMCFGKGQGAALSIFVSAFNQSIKKCSLQYPFLCDFKRVWEMDLDINYYEGIRYYFRWFDLCI